MKIASCNNFFVYYVVMFVRLNYIELHHFNLICLSFSFLQNLYVPNIALVDIRNGLRRLLFLLGKFKLQVTNATVFGM